jgi:hypothetical protein
VNSKYKLLLIVFAAQVHAATAQRVILVLPETGKSISIKFEPMPRGQDNFRAIEIDSEAKRVRFLPKSPIARIPADPQEAIRTGLPHKIHGLQLDPSRYFFRGEYTANSLTHTLLFFISYLTPYGPNDGDPLLVIGFSSNGDPYKILEHKGLDVTSFQPTGEDSALIIGKTALSEVMAGNGGNGSTEPYATTYDPYSVLVVHGESPAVYSLDASRNYNREHYVWAGPKSREDYAVLYNLPHHSGLVGAPASRVNSLLGSNRVPVQ